MAHLGNHDLSPVTNAVGWTLEGVSMMAPFAALFGITFWAGAIFLPKNYHLERTDRGIEFVSTDILGNEFGRAVDENGDGILDYTPDFSIISGRSPYTGRSTSETISRGPVNERMQIKYQATLRAQNKH